MLIEILYQMQTFAGLKHMSKSMNACIYRKYFSEHLKGYIKNDLMMDALP